MDLPFEDYSWPFTQHAVALEPTTLFFLLESASKFEGISRVGSENVGTAITRLIVDAGVLTENERDGRADAWRDYQQVLPELGLIVSTRLSPAIALTDIGRMLLSGDIGFSELVTVQALRYQYPNGFKSEIMGKHASTGVLVKPGLLILRVLLETFSAQNKDWLTVTECENCIVPAHQNGMWPDAVAALNRFRNAPFANQRNTRRRRNIQDWFKFLCRTDLFEIVSGTDNQKLCLTQYSKQHIETLLRYCDAHERPSSFWIPTTFDRNDGYRWFSYYGQIPPVNEQMLRDPQEITLEYVKNNYIGGFEEAMDSELEAFSIDEDAPNISLNPLQNRESGTRPPLQSPNLLALGANAAAGISRRQTKTTLHDSIVRDLAERFQGQNAAVWEDRDSADLIVKWHSGEEAILEVKTVNRRSLQERLRLATGQVLEYSYRRGKQTGMEPDNIIVINSAISQNSWQTKFLTSRLNIGLICKTGNVYEGFSSQSNPHSSFRYWASI